MKSFLFGLILTLGTCAAAQVLADEIYKTVDDQGNVQYSDTAPSDSAEPVELPDINLQPGVTPKVRLSPENVEGPAAIQVWISSPENDDVVNSSASSISVSGGTSRALLDNEYAQLLVNGSPYGGNSKALNWGVGDLIRGEYTLVIQIVANGRVLTSSPQTTVYVQRNFIR